MCPSFLATCILYSIAAQQASGLRVVELESLASMLGRSFKVSFVSNNFNFTERSFTQQNATASEPFQKWAMSYTWDQISLSRPSPEAIQAFEQSLLPFVIMEPEHSDAINETPPSLPAVPEACLEHPQVFEGPRTKPVKMIDVFKLGYEADVLETRLREYMDVVDYIIIVECEISLRGAPKVIMWDHLRVQDRFKPFQTKVLHLVFSNSEITQPQPGRIIDVRKDWAVEAGENDLIKARLPNILQGLSIDPSKAVINFADADEVTSRNNMHLMKHCQPIKLPVDSGIWFPMGRVDRAFRTDWPTAAGSYTYGDPTFQNLTNFVGLGRGRSGPYLLGGMHMSDYNYLPFRLLKVVSNSDSTGIPESWIELLKHGEVAKLVEGLSNMEATVFPAAWRARIISLTELYQLSPDYRQMVYLPWFLEGNHQRFPLWFGQDDPRLYVEPKAQSRIPRRC